MEEGICLFWENTVTEFQLGLLVGGGIVGSFAAWYHINFKIGVEQAIAKFMAEMEKEQ